ncbi:hypothetical protein SAMN04489758_101114 [Thomasclavelia cocleata]|uniref:Uncharacterized protein n=1 Tax=Thomasclavelia cocleata TaxID=69824 RepID=A0A1I0BG12_9FIRM|nr:hypothetical protein [Thomasclavelia cocleata]MCR1959879.1 hypothetical protein [Thomasclavelia cocleata]NDO41775.1 hypothetical protein [Thomasclavelia cocleata]SET05921.1 hypothetical protein SAMN04489758_101114 [Thomasclavelia cocleata]
MAEKQNGLKRGASSFSLVGKVAKFNKFTFQIDEKSKKSDWIYNSLNLGINCGEECGVIYGKAMGGYGKDRKNLVYVHGKDENGYDDFDNRFDIAWEDRDNKDILMTIGKNCFYKAGLKKDVNDNLVIEEFLSSYDFINYIKENLEEGMIVNVKGNLKYSFNNDDNVVVNKEIKAIYLSNKKPEEYDAKFTQTVLFDKDCLDVKKYDKDKGCLLIDGYVADYLKDYKGVDVKQTYPFKVNFEYKIDNSDNEKYLKLIRLLFKVKEGVTAITFVGRFIEGGTIVTATYDDLDDDIKQMVDMGIYELDEALDKCSVSSNRERRMMLIKPDIKMIINEDGTKTPKLQIDRKKYEESDLEFILPKATNKKQDTEMKVVDPKLDDEEAADLEKLLKELGD